MQFDTIMASGGFLLLGAAAVRGGIAACQHVRKRLAAAAAQRRDVQTFRQRAKELFEQLEPAQRAQLANWTGTRSFRITRRTDETPDGSVCSFELEPVDQKEAPVYAPGQFLSFVIPTDQAGKTVQRCYSLSDAPVAQQTRYRVSIKRIRYPGKTPGLVSNYFHDQIAVGHVVNILPPAGQFHINQNSDRPVVLVAGGVGITPLLSMLNWLVTTGSGRDIWLFHGVRNRSDHAFKNHVEQLCEAHSNVHAVTFYSRPSPSCRDGVDFQVAGHVSVKVMQALLKARDYEFYLCGPAAMMAQIQSDLVSWGVPEADIRTEQFGSPGGTRPAPETYRLNGHGAESTFQVDFLRSGKRVPWSPCNGSLLELAEASGINARCSCRAGQCGTCKVKLTTGQITYRGEPAVTIEPGMCLPCIAQPASDLSLDL